MSTYTEKANAIEQDIIKWRRDLHQIPEIGNNLPKTSEYVQNCLKDMGIPFKTLVGGNAIVALIEGGKPGKTVALRADMDALAVAEETDFDFKSTNGNMHACGHDSHAAMLLGAAKILNEQKADLKGNVKLLFQPGEEAPGGAKPMIEEGCMENPKVDAVFGQHIGNLFPDAPTGNVLVSKGKSMACRDGFKITVKGKGAHSSTPHLSVDPVNVAAHIVCSVNAIKGREIDTLSPCVISICTINAGRAANIIPEVAVMEGTTRSVDPEIRKYIAKRIEEIAKHTCEMFGATCEFEFIWDYPALVNDPEMAQHVMDSALKLIPAQDLIEQKQFIMGSEDMSFFLAEAPGAYFFLSSIHPIGGVAYNHHNPKFALDESVFTRGTALLCQVAWDYLEK